MSDAAPAAAPTAAPAPAPSSAATPPPALYASDSWHGFQQQLAERRAQGATESAPNTPEPKGLEKALAEGAVPEPKPGAEKPADHQPAAEQAQQAAPAEGQTPEAALEADRQLLDKARGWMESDKVPEEFMDRLVEVKYGNTSRWEPLGEALKSVMRQGDHTREMTKIKAEREDWARKEAAYTQYFESINDPEKGGQNIYEVFTRNGLRKQLRAASEKLAQEEEEDLSMARGAAIAFAQRHGIRDGNDYRLREAYDKAVAERARFREMTDGESQKEFTIQQLRSQQQQRVDQAAQAEYHATVERQLAQLRPRAFKALGILDNAKNDQRLRSHIAAIAQQQGANTITPELVTEAARALRDDIEDERRSGNDNGSAPTPPTPKPFQPTLGASGAGKFSGQKSPWDGTVESFEEQFIRRRR